MIASMTLTADTGVVIDEITKTYPPRAVYRFIGMGNDEKQYRAQIYYKTEGPIFHTKIGTMRLENFTRA